MRDLFVLHDQANQRIGEIVSTRMDEEGFELRYKLDKGVCHKCHQPIKVAIFKGDDWCSDNCRKAMGKGPN